MAFTDEPQTPLDGATSTGAGDWVVTDDPRASDVVFEVIVTDTATVTFEATIDGHNAYTVQATDLSDGTTSTTASSGTGLFRVTGNALAGVRPNVTSHSVGSVTVRARSQKV